MKLKEKFDEYKTVLALVVAVVVATVGVLAWASDAKEDVLKQQEKALVVMQAQSAIVHNDFYQEGRVARKEDQIAENTRELKNLLEYVGDDEPTPRQSREIDYLDGEIARLRKEIEEIRVILETDE